MAQSLEKAAHRIRMRADRSSEPFQAFFDKVFRCLELWKDAEKYHHAQPNIWAEAQGQLIVGYVSAMEVYFRDLFCACVANGNPDRIFTLLEKIDWGKNSNITVCDLIRTHRREIKLQDILLLYVNLQRYSDIDKVFSKLLGESIATVIYKGNKLPASNIVLVKSALNARHDIIHDCANRVLPDNVFNALVNSILHFVLAVEFYYLKEYLPANARRVSQEKSVP